MGQSWRALGTRSLDTTLTLPTKRLTRPSDPMADGRMLVMSGVRERVEARRSARSCCSANCSLSRPSSRGGGAGGAFAMAAAITASISADVGGRCCCWGAPPSCAPGGGPMCCCCCDLSGYIAVAARQSCRLTTDRSLASGVGARPALTPSSAGSTRDMAVTCQRRETKLCYDGAGSTGARKAEIGERGGRTGPRGRRRWSLAACV